MLPHSGIAKQPCSIVPHCYSCHAAILPQCHAPTCAMLLRCHAATQPSHHNTTLLSIRQPSGQGASSQEFSSQAHIYSLGATLKAALEYVAEPAPQLSPDLEEMLSRMQAEDPADRPDLQVTWSRTHLPSFPGWGLDVRTCFEVLRQAKQSIAPQP